MPLFDYVCKSCGHAFETLVQGSDRPACPSCGSRQLVKQLSAFAVVSGAGRAPACETGGPCASCGPMKDGGSCPFN